MSEPLFSNQKADTSEHGSLLEVTDLAKGYGAGGTLPVLGRHSARTRRTQLRGATGRISKYRRTVGLRKDDFVARPLGVACSR
jgi:hypothetical protein